MEKGRKCRWEPERALELQREMDSERKGIVANVVTVMYSRALILACEMGGKSGSRLWSCRGRWSARG